MPPILKNGGSTNSLHTIPEECKFAEEDEERDTFITDPEHQNDPQNRYQRSNSIFVNAIRRTSQAIVSLTNFNSIPENLNDERKFSTPAVEARRKNRRNGEWVELIFLIVRRVYLLWLYNS